MTLRKKIKTGHPLIGPWCTIPTPSLIGVASSAGMNFVILDMEHGCHSYETIDLMLRYAEASGCYTIVRVAQNDESTILKALDLGVNGIIIPHMESKEDVEKAIQFSKYIPIGNRGYSPYTRAGGYDLNLNHCEKQNEEIATIIILEGIKGIQNIDSMLSIPNLEKAVDAIYVGAYDLSQALGVPGEIKNTKVVEAFDLIRKKVSDKGIQVAGYVAKNKEDIKWMLERGIKLVTILPDCSIFKNAYLKYKNDFDSILSEVAL
ncbi:MAG: aldolase [Oligoflexia bacterium]|nr:aldolase [Oligoflexia bacterium]